MKATGLFLLLLPLMIGCSSASLVQKSFSPKKTGIVRYRNSKLMGDSNREKALKVMADFCSPQGYSVVEERANEEVKGYSIDRNLVTGEATGVSAQTHHFMYIAFECN